MKKEKTSDKRPKSKITRYFCHATTTNLKTTKIVNSKKGLDQEKAKKITSLVRDNYPKVKTQIQGDEVRVTSPKKR